MKRAIAGTSVSLALALAGCASEKPSPSTLPLGIDNGHGSQYGNYAAQEAGEMRGEAGERCVVFNWDRPISKDLVVRLKSASCEAKDHPGRMISHEISRTVIPLSQSTLKAAPDQAGQ